MLDASLAILTVYMGNMQVINGLSIIIMNLFIQVKIVSKSNGNLILWCVPLLIFAASLSHKENVEIRM